MTFAFGVLGMFGAFVLGMFGAFVLGILLGGWLEERYGD